MKLLLVFYLLIVVSVPLVGISSAAIVYVPDNYSSIQEAINAASVDDTVIVRNETYSENIVLNNSLSLIGEGYPSVDAQQNGSAIRITADGCVVKGFRCVNAKYPSNAGIRVDSDSNVIVNNSFHTNSDRADNIWNSPSKVIYVYNGKEYEGYMGNYWDDYRGKDEEVME